MQRGEREPRSREAAPRPAGRAGAAPASRRRRAQLPPARLGGAPPPCDAPQRRQRAMAGAPPSAASLGRSSRLRRLEAARAKPVVVRVRRPRIRRERRRHGQQQQQPAVSAEPLAPRRTAPAHALFACSSRARGANQPGSRSGWRSRCWMRRRAICRRTTWRPWPSSRSPRAAFSPWSSACFFQVRVPAQPV